MPVKDWLPAVVRSVATDRKLKAGEPLSRLSDKTAGLYEVVTGRVRLTRVDLSGHEIILYVAGASKTISDASLLSLAYHCDAIAGSDAVVRVYPKAALVTAFAEDRKVAQAFTATLARQVMGLRTRLEQRNIRSARERRYLVPNASADGDAVKLRGTVKDRASEFGLTHEALYPTLAALECAVEIRRTRGKITLLRRRRV
jgi:CRP-like cAMP-binding protein